MSRKGSLLSVINSTSRLLNQMAKEEQSRIRILEREEILRKKREKLLYIESRVNIVKEKNEKIREVIFEYENIFNDSLVKDYSINFNELLQKEKYPDFCLPSYIDRNTNEPDINSYIHEVKEPKKIFRKISWIENKYKREISFAKKNYENDCKKYQENLERISNLQKKYLVDKKEFYNKEREYNKSILLLKSGLQRGNSIYIESFFTSFLDRLEYHTNFPKNYRLIYLSGKKEIVIEYELPNINVIPKAKEFTYIKSRDEIIEKERKHKDKNILYRDLIASICLSLLYGLFNSDIYSNLLIITLNAHVRMIDPATGQEKFPCLITLSVLKENFIKVNLEKVEKIACLLNLGAQVSSNADEVIPVKPIVEFDMIDKRFVSQTDIISDLDKRPNLMDLDPFEFENLVSNLFEKIGFLVKQTQSTVDGGVDAIAFDTRPILGGKIVIQAKRYKNTVDVSAVRDLYGTMINEGANKGILICTSHYGSKAYGFAKDKPIELINGKELLYLLGQQGIKAKIVFPKI